MPIVLLIAVLPVIVSTPPRLAHLSKSTVRSAVTMRSRTIRATIRPMKKINPAPTNRGTNAITLFSSVSIGPATLPSPSTVSRMSNPKSQISSETILPSDSPRL